MGERVFDFFDFYGVGYIDIRHVDDALARLGHDLGAMEPKNLQKILAKHDQDENLLFDIDEFTHLVHDPGIQALWRCSEEGSKRKNIMERLKMHLFWFTGLNF